MAKAAALNIRIDADLKAKLQEITKRQNRSLSNLVETVLLEFVKREFTAKQD